MHPDVYAYVRTYMHDWIRWHVCLGLRIPSSKFRPHLDMRLAGWSLVWSRCLALYAVLMTCTHLFYDESLVRAGLVRADIITSRQTVIGAHISVQILLHMCTLHRTFTCFNPLYREFMHCICTKGRPRHQRQASCVHMPHPFLHHSTCMILWTTVFVAGHLSSMLYSNFCAQTENRSISRVSFQQWGLRIVYLCVPCFNAAAGGLDSI